MNPTTSRHVKAWACVAAGWLAAFAHATAALGQTSGAAASTAMSSPPVSSATSGLEQQEVRAQLKPHRYTTLAAEIGAKIKQIKVREGDAFKAGQTLATFDCSLQRAQLAKAQADLSSANQQLKANERLAELNSVGQLELDLSRSAQGKARAEVGAQQALLSKCSIAAPFSGRVAEKRVQEQQFVQAGQAMLDIIDDSALELEFLVPSRWLSWIRKGDELEVQIDETQKRYPARFTRIGARIDPVSQSIKVTAAIEGKHDELIAGMSGRIAVDAPAR